MSVDPKKTPGEFRAIIDHSHPKHKSVNIFIVKDEFFHKPLVVDKAPSFIQDLESGLYLSKIDIENAFSLITVDLSQ